MTQADTDARDHTDDVANEISRGIVQLYSTLYGRGPDHARVFAEEGYVLAVLYGCFTPAERTLIEADKGRQVEHTRKAFQEAVRDDFVAVVEKAIGREVMVFVSQTDVRTDVSVELFLLDDPQLAGGSS